MADTDRAALAQLSGQRAPEPTGRSRIGKRDALLELCQCVRCSGRKVTAAGPFGLVAGVAASAPGQWDAHGDVGHGGQALVPVHQGR